MIGELNARLMRLGYAARSGTLTGSSVLESGALAVLTGLALALYLFRLGDPSFWIDEVYTVERAAETWGRYPPDVPLSLVLTGLSIQAFGPSDWSTRFAPALIGVLSIPLIYVPVRKLFGPAVGLLSALLLVISPWQIYWAQNARFYTALMLMYALGMFALYLALELRRLRYLALGVVLLALAVVERRLALLFAPTLVAYLAVVALPAFGGFRQVDWRRLALGLTAVAAVVLFGLYTVVVARGSFELTVLERSFFGWSRNPLRILLSIMYELTLPVFFLGLAGGWYLVSRRDRAGLFTLLAASVPVAAIVGLSLVMRTHSRYVFMTLPFWLILASVAAKVLFVRLRWPATVFAFSVVVLLVGEFASRDVLYFGYQHGDRPDWKGAFEVVQDGKTPGDDVVTTRTPLGEYYLREPVVWTQGLSPAEITAKGARTWFVIDNETGFISPELRSWLRARAELVAVRDVYIPGKTFEMRVYLYDPARP